MFADQRIRAAQTETGTSESVVFVTTSLVLLGPLILLGLFLIFWIGVHFWQSRKQAQELEKSKAQRRQRRIDRKHRIRMKERESRIEMPSETSPSERTGSNPAVTASVKKDETRIEVYSTEQNASGTDEQYQIRNLSIGMVSKLKLKAARARRLALHSNDIPITWHLTRERVIVSCIVVAVLMHPTLTRRAVQKLLTCDSLDGGAYLAVI